MIREPLPAAIYMTNDIVGITVSSKLNHLSSLRSEETSMLIDRLISTQCKVQATGFLKDHLKRT